MKLTRQQFLAALGRLTSLPARWLGFAPKPDAGQPFSGCGSAIPHRDGPWLADWRQAQWVPVFQSVHPTAQRLILAAQRGEMLPLRYWGGSTPGRERCLSPRLVFQLDGSGPLYVAGYCHQRRAERVFNVGRVELLADDHVLCVTE